MIKTLIRLKNCWGSEWDKLSSFSPNQGVQSTKPDIRKSAGYLPKIYRKSSRYPADDLISVLLLKMKIFPENIERNVKILLIKFIIPTVPPKASCSSTFF